MFEAKGEGYHYCENEVCSKLYILWLTDDFFGDNVCSY